MKTMTHLLYETKYFYSVNFGRTLSDSPQQIGVCSVSALVNVSVWRSLFSLYFYQGRKKLLAATLYLKIVFKKEK